MYIYIYICIYIYTYYTYTYTYTYIYIYIYILFITIIRLIGIHRCVPLIIMAHDHFLHQNDHVLEYYAIPAYYWTTIYHGNKAPATLLNSHIAIILFPCVLGKCYFPLVFPRFY